MYRRLIGIMLLCLVITVQGCAALKKPVPPQITALPKKFCNEPNVSDLEITSSLLDLVKDDQAVELVAEALDNNHNIRAAALRLKSAGLLLSQTRAARMPQIDAGYAAGRNNHSIGQDVQSSHRVSLSFAWELDIWGKLADRHRAREKDFNARELEYFRAMDSLAARVIQTWIRIKSNRMSLDIQGKRVDIYQKIEETILKKYKAGLGNLQDISAARSRTNRARAGLTRFREIYQSSVRDLELLLGRYPATAIRVKSGLPDLYLAHPEAPASVLIRRPDVQAAVNRAESALSDAKASGKELLPNIRLTGNIFRDNSQLSRLGSSSNSWDLLGSLLFPLFNAGRIKKESESADALALAAYQDLETVVLQAVKEVENGFAKEGRLKERMIFLQKALEDARVSSAYYEARFKEGLATIIELHTARDQELEILVGILETKADRIINRVDIALALGTGALEKKMERRGNERI